MISIVWGGIDRAINQPFRPGIHDGTDIDCPTGTRIYAARAGVVERTQTGMLSVRIGNQRDFYLHGDRFQVRVGQAVARGQFLMFSGAVQVDPRYRVTGPHLHFEVQNGFSLPGAPPSAEGAPVDPEAVLVGALAGDPSHTREDSMNLTDVKGVLIAAAHGCGRGAEVTQADVDASASRYARGVPLDVLVAEVVSAKSAVAYESGVAELLAGAGAADDDSGLSAAVSAAQSAATVASASASKVEAAVKAAAAELAKA